MPQNPEEIITEIRELTQPRYRESLVSRGLARGLIWRNGVLPPESPQFSPSLSADLLDHGFLCLSNSLRLRDISGDSETVKTGLYAAAEALESAVRYGDPADSERAFYLTLAAAAFHIGGYSARAYSLFSVDLPALNLSSYEKSLVYLMRRDVDGMRRNTQTWLQAGPLSSVESTGQSSGDSEATLDDLLAGELTRVFHRAIANLDSALLLGDQGSLGEALRLVRLGRDGAGEVHHVPLWWSFTIAQHLFDDLWQYSMHAILPENGGPPDWPRLRREFIQLLGSRLPCEIELWPSQRDAAKRVLDTTDDLVVALPTSAGKTRIAELCILRALADGKRVIYVTPLRALSAQIENSLARTFRPLGYSVTSVYGASGVAVADLDTIKSASIVVATPEKLDFAVRLDPAVIDDVSLIVLDEGHMIGLSEREIRYEVMVQRLLRRADSEQRRIVCLSAVFTEGEAFDDFAGWLRSDAPGEAVRSTWRPTRQRPGTLVWNTQSARLSFQVEQERPFVPRFVEARDAIRPRRTAFPHDAQELVVDATRAFLGRGQTVLIYCPLRKSVETTAKAFLKAHSQGYFGPTISDAQQGNLKRALRLGAEWLGENHPAVECLRLGIAVHHGSLPRQFLSELETLLRQRVLPVCISSPTLAQGLDLSFGVLLFRSLYRSKSLIPAKEFANVIGRVGRAFVDLDGLYVLPVFEATTNKTKQRVREFQRLITDAQTRQLDSGIRQLIEVILKMLRDRLGLAADGLREYVLNQASTWVVPSSGEEDTYPALLQTALNELDTAILGAVDAFDTDLTALATVLDTALRSSYWQRRLSRATDESKLLQQAVLRGRAEWLWSRTSATTRRRYFAAGVGFVAGQAIDAEQSVYQQQLAAAEAALIEGRIDDVIAAVVQMAKKVFLIGPFAPDDLIGGWEELLGHWMKGTALGQCADSDGVAFIQEHVVFRLVWGIEAIRLQLQETEVVSDVPGDGLALCLTYGVPTLGAAAFMQAGVRSRVFAQAVARKAGASVQTPSDVGIWLFTMMQSQESQITWKSDAERAEWDDFVQMYGHREYSDWKEFSHTLIPEWSTEPPTPGSWVRVVREEGDVTAVVYSTEFNAIGRVGIPNEIGSRHFFARVESSRTTLKVDFFGVVRDYDYWGGARIVQG
jgi:hypothetical protein